MLAHRDGHVYNPGLEGQGEILVVVRSCKDDNYTYDLGRGVYEQIQKAYKKDTPVMVCYKTNAGSWMLYAMNENMGEGSMDEHQTKWENWAKISFGNRINSPDELTDYMTDQSWGWFDAMESAYGKPVEKKETWNDDWGLDPVPLPKTKDFKTGVITEYASQMARINSYGEKLQITDKHIRTYQAGLECGKWSMAEVIEFMKMGIAPNGTVAEAKVRHNAMYPMIPSECVQFQLPSEMPLGADSRGSLIMLLIQYIWP